MEFIGSDAEYVFRTVVGLKVIGEVTDVATSVQTALGPIVGLDSNTHIQVRLPGQVITGLPELPSNVRMGAATSAKKLSNVASPPTAQFP